MASYGYFPGCSLGATAKAFDISTRAVFEKLAIGLKEVDDWGCCGATSGHSTNREMADALAARNLYLAAEQGHGELVVPCAACYNRTKRAAHALHAGGERAKGIHQALGGAPASEVAVRHIIEALSADEVREAIRSGVKRGLGGVRAAAYYGCLLLRPIEEVSFDDPEDPRSMDDLLADCGASPVEWHFKNECCGASHGITNTSAVCRLVGNIVEDARRAGADWLVVACPLCQVNLENRQTGMSPLPVLYITQAIGLALGMEPRELGLPKFFRVPEAREVAS